MEVLVHSTKFLGALGGSSVKVWIGSNIALLLFACKNFCVCSTSISLLLTSWSDFLQNFIASRLGLDV